MSRQFPDPGLPHPDSIRPTSHSLQSPDLVAASGDKTGAGEAGVQVCPKCDHRQRAGRIECERCGVIFAKVRERDAPEADPLRKPESAAGEEITPEGGWAAQLAGLLFEVPAEEMPLLAVGRAIVYVGLLVWGWRFILAPIKSNTVGESFIHLVNLPFHEAGHILFGFFGRFIGVLGGSLMQLLVPAIVFCAFVYRRNVFGGAVGLWWLGENCLDLAPYIDDARAGRLMLLGGVTGREVEDYHDWEVILRDLGWLRHDHAIARLAHGLGAVLILLSFVWGGYILYRQFRRAE
jgi:hypothetical protein